MKLFEDDMTAATTRKKILKSHLHFIFTKINKDFAN